MSEQIRHDHSVDCAWDLVDCDPQALADPELAQKLHEDVVESGFTPAFEPPFQFKRFDGGGFSFLEMFMESHGALHGSPENAYCIEETIHSCYIVGLDENRKSPQQKTEDLHRLWVARLRPHLIIPKGSRVRANMHSTIYPMRRSLARGRLKTV